MAKHNELGQKGERLAVDFLKKKGYLILETNWRFSRAEIDVIAKDGNILVFIEVKTRSDDAFGQPEEFVSSKKERLIMDAASVYMEEIGHDWEIRFDIIAILYKSDKDIQIKHFEDAFFSEW